MLQNKLNNLIKQGKGALAFALILVFGSFKAQDAIIDTILKHRNKQANFYQVSFEKNYKSSLNNNETIEKGNIYAIVDKTDTLVRVVINKRYDAVKSKLLQGINYFNDTSFIDMSDNTKRLHSNYDDYVNPILYFQSDLEERMSPGKNRVTCSSEGDYYIVKSVQKEPSKISNLDGDVPEVWLMYKVSKKNYQLVDFTFYAKVNINGAEWITNSSITYTYNTASYKKVKSNIDGFKKFKPFVMPELKPEDKPENLKTFPNLIVTDTALVKKEMYANTSKLVLVEFWYKSCGPCLANMKELNKLADTFKKDEVTFIALNSQDSVTTNVKRLLIKMNLKFEVDFISANQLPFKLFSFPSTFVYSTIDKKVIYYSKGGGTGYAHNMSDFLHGALGH